MSKAEEIEMYIRAYSDVLLEEGEFTIHIDDLKELIKRVSQSYSDQENKELRDTLDNTNRLFLRLVEKNQKLQSQVEELREQLENYKSKCNFYLADTRYTNMPCINCGKSQLEHQPQ